MSEWTEYRLSDIASIRNKKRVPLNSRQRATIQGDYPYYGASGVVDYVNDYIFDGQHVLISEDGENLRSRQTPIAFIADGQFWVNNHAHILQGNDELINEFIVYYFHCLDITPFITGAVQPKLNQENLLSIPIFMPNREERLGLTRLLNSLDRKIDTLRKQNDTLEKIAQTLFKHWFIDFEFPNANGKPYKSSGGAMESSELGEIPAGWCVGKMQDVIEVRDGTHESPKQTAEGFHLITSKHLKKEGIDFESAYLISEADYLEANKRSRVHTLDILLSMIGTVGLLYFVLEKEINFAIKNIGLFKSSQAPSYSEFIFLWLTSIYGRSYFRTRMAGTTQAYITLASLREMPLLIPKESFLIKFREVVRPIFSKSYAHREQIQTLTKTRDALLPKLMSGKLRIPED